MKKPKTCTIWEIKEEKSQKRINIMVSYIMAKHVLISKKIINEYPLAIFTKFSINFFYILLNYILNLIFYLCKRSSNIYI